jgi:hypothetical protein
MEAVGLKKCLECFELPTQSGVSRKKPILRACGLHFEVRKIDKRDLA